MYLGSTEDVNMTFESVLIAMLADSKVEVPYKGQDQLSFGSCEHYNRFTDPDSLQFVEGKLMLAAGLGALSFRFPEQGEAIRNLILDIAKAIDNPSIDEIIYRIAELIKDLKNE